MCKVVFYWFFLIWYSIYVLCYFWVFVGFLGGRVLEDWLGRVRIDNCGFRKEGVLGSFLVLLSLSGNFKGNRFVIRGKVLD